jgi:CDGSH-type Zn-finger protein
VDITVDVCLGGPLLVRGPIVLRDEEGAEILLRRNVIALCRCGRSRRAPFCDSSHTDRRPGRRSTGPKGE